MTIQDFIKQGHKWIELKGVPVRDSHSKSIVFIHNHFFEGKELEFQNELIANFMKLCHDKEWSWRVYGGDTPDAEMVGWIYTQTAEIVSGDESVMPAWCKNGQHVLFEGKLHVIECAPKKEYEHLHEVIIEDCETHHCHFENWDNLTPCTPDGRELLPEPPTEAHIDVEPTLEPASEITDAPIVKREPFGKMFIYRLYIKWKWMQQRFERIGDMDRAADCFYHRLRLTKLYIYQPGWRIMDYGDMKPIFFPRQRIK